MLEQTDNAEVLQMPKTPNGPNTARVFVGDSVSTSMQTAVSPKPTATIAPTVVQGSVSTTSQIAKPPTKSGG
jgi:hypothetical protein